MSARAEARGSQGIAVAPSRARDRGFGLLIGAVLTVGCALAQFCGWSDLLDRVGLDLHFRHVSPVVADPRIVHVDIDDGALRLAPEWPWPRRWHAGLVRTLTELGAESIVLDFVFDRPSSRRNSASGGDDETPEFADREGSALHLGLNAIDDDAALRDAIAEAGNVYLAMYAESQEMEGGAGAPPPHLMEAVEALVNQFDLDLGSLGRLLGLSRSSVELALAPVFPQAKRRAAAILAERFVGEHAEADRNSFDRSALKDTDFAMGSADRNLLHEAFDSERAIRAVLDRGLGRGDWPGVSSLVPPLEALVRAAKGVGIVSFERARGGGVVRSFQPFVSLRRTSLPQLGVLVATDHLGVDSDGSGVDARRRVSANAADAVGLSPLDAQGEALIGWIRPRQPDDWRNVFEHVSASPFLEIMLNDEAIGENRRRLDAARMALVRVRHAETPAEYNDYVRLRERCTALAARIATELTTDVRESLNEEYRNNSVRLQAVEADATTWLERMWNLWSTTEPETDDEKSQRAAIRRLHDLFIDHPLDRQVEASNATLATRTLALKDSLRSRITGRICFVGYTASAQGDLVTTPTLTSMPGVMAHAHITNMLLQKSVPRRASPAVDALLLLVLGALATWMTCRWNAPTSLIGCGLLAGAALLFGAGWFFARLVHVASLVGCTECGVVWAGVTTYRQLTEERTRRRLQRALSQYTSPAIAVRLAGRVREADLAPRSAMVTCFFSDLRGFTRMSERLGPARTRERLNPYLGVLSAALIDERAIVNKFIGDGVMAFFNSPILPCSDHARSACRAALAARDGIARLEPRTRYDTDEDRLFVRIGMATGEAFVGDYGTASKLDYTCIGDTVNVASRLERINKAIGTQLLVDGTTREAAGDEFLFRPLGRVMVAGRQTPVECWELIGFLTDADPSQRAYVQAFGEVVGHFGSGRWTQCLAALAVCRSERADDPLLRFYADLVESARTGSIDASAVGALRIPAMEGA